MSVPPLLPSQVSHALGDAFSPYLIGVIADWVRPALTPEHHMKAWQAVQAVRAGGVGVVSRREERDQELVMLTHHMSIPQKLVKSF